MSEQRDKRDLVRLLREADTELQAERLSPEADRRLRELVQGGTRRWALPPLLVLAPVAAAAVALLVWAIFPGQQLAPAPKHDRLEGFSVVAGTVRTLQHRVRCLSTACTLDATGLRTRLKLGQGAVVRREKRHVRVMNGQATLDVTPRRRPDGVLKVYVSHGQIQVLGTRFTVVQRAGGGQVKLHRGAIRFVDQQGRARDVVPGQTLTWPLKDPPAVVQTTPAKVARPRPLKRARPAKKPAPALTPQEAESLGNKVARLRSQGRYAQAARELRLALPRITDRGTRVRYSYELGGILTYQLPDPAAACRHWRRHLRRFGPGGDAEGIRLARQKAGCPAARPQQKKQ